MLDKIKPSYAAIGTATLTLLASACSPQTAKHESIDEQVMRTLLMNRASNGRVIVTSSTTGHIQDIDGDLTSYEAELDGKLWRLTRKDMYEINGQDVEVEGKDTNILKYSVDGSPQTTIALPDTVGNITGFNSAILSDICYPTPPEIDTDKRYIMVLTGSLECLALDVENSELYSLGYLRAKSDSLRNEWSSTTEE
jgi:hypothetical protein